MSNKATNSRGASSCIANREDCHKEADEVACQKMLQLLQDAIRLDGFTIVLSCRLLLVAEKSMLDPSISQL